MTWRNAISAGGVVMLCGGVLAAGTAWQAQSTPEGPPVTNTTLDFLRSARLTCPGVVDGDDRAFVAAVAVPETPGQNVPGSVAVTAADGRELTAVTRPGATALVDPIRAGERPVVAAEGGLAPGLVTHKVTADPRGQGTGLAGAPCVPATAESWFLGGGSAAEQRSLLHLTNPTGGDALVDLTAFGKGGRLELTGDEGVTIAAGQTREIRLDALAPDMEHLALRVRTRMGLIAAVLVDDRTEGLTPMGSEYLLDRGPARRDIVLGGMPGGAGQRELHMIAPKATGAVRLTALTEHGSLPLLAGQPVPVKRGALTTLDLTRELGGRVAAIRIDADVPVVAATVATTAVDSAVAARRREAVAAAERAIEQATGEAERRAAEAGLAKAETANAIDPAEDYAWFGPAPVIPRTTAVTGLRADLDATVLLTGTRGPGTATIALLPANQSGAKVGEPRSVAVPDGSTVAVPLEAPSDTYTAIVTATDGRIHVSQVQSESGRSITGTALTPLRVRIPLTAAQPEYGRLSDTTPMRGPGATGG